MTGFIIEQIGVYVVHTLSDEKMISYRVTGDYTECKRGTQIE